ncbi:MAG: Fpg/Nei family DNA glycosylase [Thermoleophilia bacterium]
MPELPEVEVAKKTLSPCVLGKKINSVLVTRRQSIRTPLEEPELFAAWLKNRTMERIERHGKVLLFHLDGGMSLVFHFKLGAEVRCGDKALEETGGVAINFTDGTSLDFSSFALSEFHLMKTAELDRLGVLKAGADPLARSFSLKRFHELLPANKQVKAALCDQTRILGIGNSWADEILWEARLSPFRRSGDLTEKEFSELYGKVKSTLREGIRLGGESSFIDGRGRKGRYKRVVHGHAGRPCPRDRHPIEMVKRGRTTFWCPHCQK